jgi:ABC-2 type transport system ATP-binding protein
MRRAGENVLRFEVRGSVGPLLRELAGWPVVSLSAREPSLEEIFLHHYENPDGHVGETAGANARV